MGYPGVPKIDAAAKNGKETIAFPRIFLEENSYDFSFSGLKSAVLNYINKANMMGEKIIPEDVAASFQAAVIDVLLEKTMRAVEQKGVYKIALAGGVASNSALRQRMKEECQKRGYTLNIPSPIFCTDNAAMIGCAAYYEYQKGIRDSLDLNANPSLKLGER